MKYKLVDNGKKNQTIIKVVGVGGCGGNAIDHMVTNGVDGVETISAVSYTHLTLPTIYSV